MVRSWTCAFVFILAIILVCTNALCQIVENPFQIDTVSFKFSQFNKKFFLVPHEGKKIKIPKAWLYPPKDVEKDHDSSVSSFNYLKPVNSFRIDKDFVGLHLSSWDSMPPGSGSAMAGIGRDIFLVYCTKTRHIYPGILNLGITKARIRLMGCFGATFHNFIIGDINNDGLTDIGVKLERIWCEEKSDQSQHGDFLNGPYYKEYPIEWYIFRENKWIRAPEFNGIQPKKPLQKMPLIGLTKSPIDFVREIHKNKLHVIK